MASSLAAWRSSAAATAASRRDSKEANLLSMYGCRSRREGAASEGGAGVEGGAEVEEMEGGAELEDAGVEGGAGRLEGAGSWPRGPCEGARGPEVWKAWNMALNCRALSERGLGLVASMWSTVGREKWEEAGGGGGGGGRRRLRGRRPSRRRRRAGGA